MLFSIVNFFKKCVVTESSCFQLLPEDTNVSQGSVATHLRCGWVFSVSIIAIFDSDSKRSFKIGQCNYDEVIRH